MNKIRCANAICIKDGKILLTRESNQGKYYLPGGKIEEDEALVPALKRELSEELNFNWNGNETDFLFTFEGSAVNSPEQNVQLNCFYVPNIIPAGVGFEVHDFNWISLSELNNVAPVVVEALKVNKQLLKDKYVA
mgnify:CR=1 FL=1|jgi:8-oxo-dGTP diphosphatase